MPTFDPIAYLFMIFDLQSQILAKGDISDVKLYGLSGNLIDKIDFPLANNSN
jgi:hypothetical protein